MWGKLGARVVMGCAMALLAGLTWQWARGWLGNCPSCANWVFTVNANGESIVTAEGMAKRRIMYRFGPDGLPDKRLLGESEDGRFVVLWQVVDGEPFLRVVDGIHGVERLRARAYRQVNSALFCTGSGTLSAWQSVVPHGGQVRISNWFVAGAEPESGPGPANITRIGCAETGALLVQAGGEWWTLEARKAAAWTPVQGGGRLVGWSWQATENGSRSPTWALVHERDGLAVEKVYDPPGFFNLFGREAVFLVTPGGGRRPLVSERLTPRGPADVVVLVRGAYSQAADPGGFGGPER